MDIKVINTVQAVRIISWSLDIAIKHKVMSWIANLVLGIMNVAQFGLWLKVTKFQNGL